MSSSDDGESGLQPRFWGCRLEQDSPAEFALDGMNLHLSRVVLEGPKDRKATAKLWAEVPILESPALLTSLSSIPGYNQCNLDIDFFQRDGQVRLWMEGTGTMHLAGHISLDERLLQRLEDDAEDEDVEEDALEEEESDTDEDEEDDEEEGGGADGDEWSAIREAERQQIAQELNAARRDGQPQKRSRRADAEETAREKQSRKRQRLEAKAREEAEARAEKERIRREMDAAVEEASKNPELEGGAAAAPGKKKSKKEGKKKSKKEMAAESEKPTTRVLKGGVKYLETERGLGKAPTPGRNVVVSYVGRLANGKVFDQNSSFRFRLGVGQVIQGWDVGVAAMRVGGKGRLIVPPKMGYGSAGAGPIPGNATLLFDIELRQA